MAEQDKRGETAVIKAAKNGDLPVAAALLLDRHDEKVQHNTAWEAMAIRDQEGRSALIYAAMNRPRGHRLQADFLQPQGKRQPPYPGDKYGKTALMYAAEEAMPASCGRY